MITYTISTQGKVNFTATMTREEEKANGGADVRTLWHDTIKQAMTSEQVTLTRSRDGRTTHNTMSGCLVSL